jgi:hypothetical protein
LGNAHFLQHLDGAFGASALLILLCCKIIASMIWSPMVCTGLSEVIGS